MLLLRRVERVYARVPLNTGGSVAILEIRSATLRSSYRGGRWFESTAAHQKISDWAIRALMVVAPGNFYGQLRTHEAPRHAVA